MTSVVRWGADGYIIIIHCWPRGKQQLFLSEEHDLLALEARDLLSMLTAYYSEDQ